MAPDKWVHSVGRRWRCAVLNPDSNIACETGGNGRAHFQGFLTVRTTLTTDAIPPSAIAAAKQLSGKKKIQKLQNLKGFAPHQPHTLNVIAPDCLAILRAGYTMKEFDRIVSFLHASPGRSYGELMQEFMLSLVVGCVAQLWLREQQ